MSGNLETVPILNSPEKVTFLLSFSICRMVAVPVSSSTYNNL